jgi:hypothetical protein
VLFTCRNCMGNGAHATMFGMEYYKIKPRRSYKSQPIPRRIARLAKWITRLDKELARRAASAS